MPVINISCSAIISRISVSRTKCHTADTTQNPQCDVVGVRPA